MIAGLILVNFCEQDFGFFFAGHLFSSYLCVKNQNVKNNEESNYLFMHVSVFCCQCS